jgi:hypothetical protein
MAMDPAFRPGVDAPPVWAVIGRLPSKDALVKGAGGLLVIASDLKANNTVTHRKNSPRLSLRELIIGVREHELGLGQLGFDDLARLARRLALRQGVDMLHAFGHFAPNGVLTVQEGEPSSKTDEELAVAPNSGSIGAGHGDGAAHMGGRRRTPPAVF